MLNCVRRCYLQLNSGSSYKTNVLFFFFSPLTAKPVIRVLDSFSHVPREKMRLLEFKNKKAYLVPPWLRILEIHTSHGQDIFKFRGNNPQHENCGWSIPYATQGAAEFWTRTKAIWQWHILCSLSPPPNKLLNWDEFERQGWI